MYWLGATVLQGAVELYRRKKGVKTEDAATRNKSAASTSLSEWRRRIQINFLFVSIIIGWEFTVFYLQVVSDGQVTAHRPAGIESFLPLSAVLGLKCWLFTGSWDMTHPAGLAFLLAVIVSAVLFRRAFCSWVCPFGTISRFLEWIRHKLLRLPLGWKGQAWIRWIALSVKYIFLALIVWVIWSMSLDSVDAFLLLPYNKAADANMLLMLLHPSTIGLLVITFLIVLSVIVRNGWCRFLCPYGALVAIAGLISPLRIVRNETACQHCASCNSACGMGIKVQEKNTVHSPECTMCLSCVSVCPENDALSVSTLWRSRVRNWIVPVGTIGILLTAYILARSTGHWNSSLTISDFQNAYRTGVRLQ